MDNVKTLVDNLRIYGFTQTEDIILTIFMSMFETIITEEINQQILDELKDNMDS